MSRHKYRVRLDYLGDGKDASTRHPEPMQFEVANHDDIFAIVPWMRDRTGFDETNAQAFTVGLKLFGEVMLKNKKDPLFSEFYPQFIEFMKKLKGVRERPAKLADEDGAPAA